MSEDGVSHPSNNSDFISSFVLVLSMLHENVSLRVEGKRERSVNKDHWNEKEVFIEQQKKELQSTKK